MARRDLAGAVDFGHLESFAAGDAALVEEVLALFREQASLWVRLLDPEGPDEGWRDAAHTLKGSALGVGASTLAARRCCSTASATPWTRPSPTSPPIATNGRCSR
jgi:hypothetical protein